MFPESSGVYIAKRDNKAVVVRIKGVYPSLTLDKAAIDLGSFLSRGKVLEAPKELLDNIEIFHTEWDFYPLKFIDFGVFSNTEFAPDSSRLYMDQEEILMITGKYYRMCQQGVSPTKIIRALACEFKTTKEQIIKFVNALDEYASY